MPTKPKTFNPYPRARRTARQVDDRNRRGDAVKSFRSSALWRKARLLKLATDPLCQPCEAKGKVTPGTQVHHRISIRRRFDLRLVQRNLETVCTACHSGYNAKERTR